MKARAPQIIAMLLAIAAIAAFFLPYISSTEEYSHYIESRATEKVFQSADLTVGDMKDMSLFEYAKVYLQARQEIFRDDAAGILYTVLIGAIGVGAVLAFLCAWGKKPILLMMMTLLMGGAFYVTNWDFMDRRIMPDSNRVWGISHEMLYPVAVLLLICAVWMFIAKRMDKKHA